MQPHAESVLSQTCYLLCTNKVTEAMLYCPNKSLFSDLLFCLPFVNKKYCD